MPYSSYCVFLSGSSRCAGAHHVREQHHLVRLVVVDGVGPLVDVLPLARRGPQLARALRVEPGVLGRKNVRPSFHVGFPLIASILKRAYEQILDNI